MTIFAYVVLVMMVIYGLTYLIGFAIFFKEKWRKSSKFGKVFEIWASTMDLIIYIMAIFGCLTFMH